jgi:hypothetical protein
MIIILFSPSRYTEIQNQDRLIMAGLFIASCFFGISLAVKPNWRYKFIRSHPDVAKKKLEGVRRKGHHPDCRKFKNHVINIKNKYYCVGCLGLTLGALISIVIFCLYILFPWDLSREIFIGIFFSGLLLVMLVLLETGRNYGSRGVHLFSNLLLVQGFLLVVVSVFQTTGSAMFGFVAIIICFLWLDTRIQLSRWGHLRTCKRCSRSCKSF